MISHTKLNGFYARWVILDEKIPSFFSSSLTMRRDADTFHGKEYITFFFAPNEVKNEFGVTS